MCDFEAKLVAWIDNEVPFDEADRVERHVAECKECRARIATFKDVGRGFDAYCELIAGENVPPPKHRWAPVLSLAAVAIVTLLFARTIVKKQVVEVVNVPAVITALPRVSEKAQPKPTSVKSTERQRRTGVKEISKQHQDWRSTGGAVQIAIPADSMFAPGAVPQGVNFIAELRIAPDGSVEQVLLRQ